MSVLVYAPAYWWAARRPATHRHLIVIGFLGKILGPIGFAFSVANDDIPRHIWLDNNHERPDLVAGIRALLARLRGGAAAGERS